MLSPGSTYLIRGTVDMRDRSGIRFAGGGTFHTKGSAGQFLIGSDQIINDGVFPEQDIDPATTDDMTVSTVSAPVGLAVGDWLLIYSGPSLAGGVYAPDSEMNKVAGISGNTITLEYPLTKPYTDDGTNPLALRKVSVSEDITFGGINVIHEGPGAFMGGNLVVNLNIIDVTATCDNDFMSFSPWAFGGMSGCTIHVNEEYAYWFAVAYGARDVTVSDCVFTATTLGYVHIHEGAANITLRDVDITNAPAITGTAQPIIGLRGMAHNALLERVTVTNGPDASGGACLRADPPVTGSALDCVFDITNGGFYEYVVDAAGIFVVDPP